jgi:hypothetical protein
MRLGLNLGSSRRRHLVQPGASPTVEVLRMMVELALRVSGDYKYALEL